ARGGHPYPRRGLVLPERGCGQSFRFGLGGLPRPVWTIIGQYFFDSSRKCGSLSVSWHCWQTRSTRLMMPRSFSVNGDFWFGTGGRFDALIRASGAGRCSLGADFHGLCIATYLGLVG